MRPDFVQHLFFLRFLRFAVHGLVENFTTASKGASGHGISGYQPVCPDPEEGYRRCVMYTNQSDVRTMSSTQGWTCGNLMAPPRAVASFFYELLGPPSTGPNPLLSPESLRQMLTFKEQGYFGHRDVFGYGLGMVSTKTYSLIPSLRSLCNIRLP